MAIVQIEPFDVNVCQVFQFATGGLWANLPRLCRGVPAARLLMVSDAIRVEDVSGGFRSVAVPEGELPGGVRAYRVHYEDFLTRQVARETRYMRLYLVMDSYLSNEGLASLLGTYGIVARPLERAVPQPFVGGKSTWHGVVGEDGRRWAMLRTRTRQSGYVYPRTLHRLFGLEFPVWAALNVYTFRQAEADRQLRLKRLSARYDRSQGDQAQEAQEVLVTVDGIRHEMNRFGAGLHTVRLYVLVGGATAEELRRRLDVVRGAIPLALEPAPATDMPRVFSAEALVSSEGMVMTTPGVAILAGSAQSFRRRTETAGVYLGTDQNQSQVIFDVFSDKWPSHNLVVLGQTGSGKTFAVLLLIIRHLLLGTRGVIIDPQGNVDLGFLGRQYHKAVLGTAGASINILDVTRGELADQVASVKNIMDMLGVVDRGNSLEMAVLDEVLMDVYGPLWGRLVSPRDMPTLSAVRKRVEMMSGRASLPAVRDTAALLAYKLRPFTGGSLAGLFNRPTTVDFSLDRLVTVYDVSRLPDQTTGGNLRAALLAILVADVNQAIRRRRRQGDTVPILFFVDEMGILMRDAAVAAYISAEYKTARARRVGMIVADQDLHSLLGPRDEHGIHHGIPILANAVGTLIFRQKGSEKPAVREHFPDIPDTLLNKLEGMRPGTCIAQLPDDLLIVHVLPSELDRVLLSSRLQDRQRARELIHRLTVELGLDE